jgi:DNA-binding transcriptional LysR family regulator
MVSTTIGWELYRSFLGVLTQGSLSAAARALGITQPTVGRHISALERELGVVLFTRSQTGLLPTDAAVSLRPYAEAMESTAAALERAAGSRGDGEGVSGVVRISCSDVIGIEVLPSVLAQLREVHPHLKIELVLTDRLQDLLRREADIAVRMVQPKQEQLLARRIGRIELGLYARRDYLERHGMPRSVADLSAHSMIGYDQLTAFVRQAEKSLKGLRRDLFSVRSDSNLAQLALIRAGAGIGMCQVPLARRAGDLMRVLPKIISLPMETWVTMHEDLRASPHCRATFDALAAGLLDYL